jgi:hypothetical protein
MVDMSGTHEELCMFARVSASFSYFAACFSLLLLLLVLRSLSGPCSPCNSRAAIDAIIRANCFTKLDSCMSPPFILGIDGSGECCRCRAVFDLLVHPLVSCLSSAYGSAQAQLTAQNTARTITSDSDNKVIPATPPCLFLVA